MTFPKMIRRTMLAFALAGAAPAFADEVKGVDGRWEGELATPAGSLPLVLRVATADGDTTAILNSPAQTQMDIPVDSVKADGDNVVFTIAMVQGDFTAQRSDDGKTLTGAWTQMGQSLPLTMTLQPGG